MFRRFALAAICLLLAACTKSSTSGGTGQRHSWSVPGQLRVAVQSDLKNLNPLLNSNTTDVFVDRLMFEPLLSADDKGNPLPMLASDVPTIANGGISSDGLTITYHLRNDAKWTDGVAVTSKDVKWSWQAIMNPNNNVVSRHGYDVVASIDTPDDTTVVVHLKEKFAPFVDTFFAESDQPYMIAPAHVLAQYPNINQVEFNNKPTVSDGPFKFVTWARGDHISLERNDDFFMGKPGLDGIKVTIVPDEDTSVNLLRTHEIDYMFQASIQNYINLRGIPDTQIVWVNVNGYEGLTLNLTNPFLRDPAVRSAIILALDKRLMVHALTMDTQTVATEDIPNWMWAYNTNLEPTAREVGEAHDALLRDGFKEGPDGIMRKNGQRLSLVLVTNNSNVTRRRVALLVQGMLGAVGIDVQIKYYPGDILFAPAGMGGILQLGKFDMSANGWYSGIDPDDSSQFMCKNFPPSGYNYSRYCNPEMEAAQRTALTSYDQRTRKAAYDKIQELLARDNPALFFYWIRQMEPISVDFKGFDPNPVVESWNAWEWTI
ncbi:MAG TPA: peptide ABC transporter substrate-binding protein [Candidatus Cybelea sp.]|nr:peptide ABC transporter substrate-binding protein [Candidatus Cybelea sp.]